MGRGRSSSGGSRGSSSSGGSRGFSSSSRGRSSFSSVGRWRSAPRHTTVIIGGHHSGSYQGGSKSGVSTLIFMAVIFILFGLVPFGIGTNIIVQANRYDTVQAVCLDNTYSGGWYYTTYEYTVKGIEYENESSVGWEFPETKGKTVTIYYLKSNPNQITEESPTEAWKGAIVMVFSLIFIGVGALLIYTAVKQKKQEKLKTEELSETTNHSTVEETEIKCPYCGSKYNKNLNSCPHCGASKK